MSRPPVSYKELAAMTPRERDEYYAGLRDAYAARAARRVRRPDYLGRWAWFVHRLGLCEKAVGGYRCGARPDECGRRDRTGRGGHDG